MKIETKFDVNNLVKRKFDKQLMGKKLFCLEVMEVISQTCYAGTQVFYLCRPVYAENNRNEWDVFHGVNATSDNQTGWRKYREDELVQCSDEEIKIILGEA